MSAPALPNRSGAAPSLRGIENAAIIFGLLPRGQRIEAAGAGALTVHPARASHTAGRILDP